MRRPRQQRLGVRRAVQVRQVRQVLALLRHSGTWDRSQWLSAGTRLGV